MRKIRVLVVDDSAFIRRLLTATLNEDVDIEVVGTAPNGRIAIAKLSQVNPDVVTLDIEMTEMNGMETLIELRKTFPHLPVIMFSSLTQHGADETLEALANGANDYAAKPANVSSIVASLNQVRDELVPKVKGICKWYVDSKCGSRDFQSPKSKAPRKPLQSLLANHRIDIVALGVSTGGPNALARILPHFPSNFPVPIVIVQHMPAVFTQHLANRLNANCTLHVMEGEAGDTLKPGCVYIAPGNMHLTLKRNGSFVQLETNQSPPENSCRPAVDVLFRSVAENYGRNALVAVLTGMGQDGLRGCEVVASEGGVVYAQDEETSVVWGMPAAVVKANLAQKILPLDKISQEIQDRCMVNRAPCRDTLSTSIQRSSAN